MRFRKLRIAWSVFSALVAVLLIVLWFLGRRSWYGDQLHIAEMLAVLAVYAACVLIILIVGIGVAVHPRYSLRTLLIATTLVAIVLGLIVWAIR
jgi:uncharacterized membrane protein